MAPIESRPPHVFVWRVLTIAWSVNMFWMSTGRFSGARSQSFLRVLFDLLGFHISPNSLDLVNSILRRGAHLMEYAILGYLVYRSFANAGSPLRVGAWCVVAASLYSLTDELHQSFVPGRHASLIDCGVDALGAAIAMALVYMNSVFLKKRKTEGAGERITAQ